MSTIYRTLVTKGVGFISGLAAGRVIEDCIKNIKPEPATKFAAIVQKIGIYGITVAVSELAACAVESEVSSYFEAFDMVFGTKIEEKETDNGGTGDE